MPTPRQRSRTKKRTQTRLPSGSGLTTRFKKKKQKALHCINCGRIISGVAQKETSKLKQLPLSKKRPQRMFGGQLCNACLRESLKQAARSAIPA
jgi:large subunit ribosomal protein L34e